MVGNGLTLEATGINFIAGGKILISTHGKYSFKKSHRVAGLTMSRVGRGGHGNKKEPFIRVPERGI
jgi:hypothetical protein